MQLVPLDEEVIQDTVDAVFSAPEFTWGRDWWWWTRYIPEIRLEALRPWLIALLAALLTFLLVREIARRRLAGPGEAAARRAAEARAKIDPWQHAQSLAARGEYTEAAHALHAALLESLARRDAVRLHPAKTTGDYLRELRLRAAPLRAPFHDFSRAYDVVAWGLKPCDAERYTRLTELARPIVSAGG